MEHRFGIKDLFLFILMAVLIVVVLLQMKQNDRQYEVLQQISSQAEDQMRELTSLHRDLNRMRLTADVQAANPSQSLSQAQLPNTGPDPFRYVKEAEALPGYTEGDWFINVGPNSDKMTPFLAGDTFAAEVQGHVFDTLIGTDEVTLEKVPNLATSWEVQDNTKAYFDYVNARKAKGATDDDIARDPNVPCPETVTFEMRPNVTFSDGDPLTADDVAWTYQWVMNPKVEAPRDRSYLSQIKSVEATNSHEVVFRFATPNFDPVNLAGSINILSKRFYEKYSPDDFNKSTGLLMGSNAYRMENPTGWVPGQTVVLVRNDRYWGAPPALDRIIYRIIDNDLARLTAFRNGEIDIYGDPLVYAAQPEPYQKLIGDPSVIARTRHFEYDTPTGGFRYIAWNEQYNGKATVFADKRVRQAMTMLIDRDWICRVIMHGYATPITGPFYVKGKQNNPDIKPWPFDIAGAKVLLKQAGFVDDGTGSLKKPDGTPFQFKLTYPSGITNYDEIALFLKDTFAKAGITVIPDPLDWSVFADHLKNRNFEVISLGWSASIEDDLYQTFDSRQIADAGDDFISYKDPQLDKLIEQARSTLDDGKRMQLWKECHALIHEDQPYTFLFARKGLTVMDRRVNNVKVVPVGLNSDAEWFVPRGSWKWEK